MDAGSRRVEKRNRPPVSCEPCRTRKLKCNRALPCDTCIRRDKPSICNYAANANRNKPGPSKPRELKDRLNALESLVSSIVSGEATFQPRNNAETTASISSSDAALSSSDRNDRNSDHHWATTSPLVSSGAEYSLTPETPHLQETDGGQVNYIDPGHWLSILNDIQEVREHLAVSDPRVSQSGGMSLDVGHGRADASLLMGPDQNANLDDVIRWLPSQPICDMLLSWYFNSRFMVLGIIHPVKFQNEYAAFRQSPSTAPPLWIALLFSILGISRTLRRISHIQETNGSIPPLSTLQQGTMQCLVLGRYATANAHALEAFILHLQSCFFSSNSLGIDPWFEMGTIIRLAFRMGYHRDPNDLSGISPFDSEMRRRVWLNIFQIDALMSFQMGFPSMIPTEFCNTGVPRNLEYSDLHIDMAVLPPSRPLSESTPVLYTIVKASVMSVFKKIVAHTHSLSTPTYDKTLALDTEMNTVYKAVPEQLKRRDINNSFIDHSSLILERCTIETLYLKGLIILHRRYITHEPQSPPFEYSRSACVDAALDILARQADLYKACEPGGRLYEDRWLVFTLPVHDFLLAAMVICLDLSIRMRLQGEAMMLEREYEYRSGREFLALQRSQQIWSVNKAASPEANVAALALGLMIKKVGEHDAGFALVRDGWGGGAQDLSGLEYPQFDSMAMMIDGSEDIDWALLDQYFLHMDAAVPETGG